MSRLDSAKAVLYSARVMMEQFDVRPQTTAIKAQLVRTSHRYLRSLRGVLSNCGDQTKECNSGQLCQDVHGRKQNNL